MLIFLLFMVLTLTYQIYLSWEFHFLWNFAKYWACFLAFSALQVQEIKFSLVKEPRWLTRHSQEEALPLSDWDVSGRLAYSEQVLRGKALRRDGGRCRCWARGGGAGNSAQGYWALELVPDPHNSWWRNELNRRGATHSSMDLQNPGSRRSHDSCGHLSWQRELLREVVGAGP